MNTTNLSAAKRDLEKAVDFAKGYARARYAAVGKESPLCYFYANAANLKSFQKRVAQANTGDGLLAGDSSFANLVISAVTQYQQVEELAAAEKSRKAGKRAAVAAKRDLKAELNLQEGVSLKGVDVGQYKVILAGLEPVRLHVYAVQKAALEKNCADIFELVEKHAGDTKLANPATYHLEPRGFARDLAFEKHNNLDRAIRRWFSVGYDGKATTKPAAEIARYIQGNAAQFALAYVQGYACKLSVKTGEWLAEVDTFAGWTVDECRVSSSNLWADSTATIKVSNPRGAGCSVLTFHTQIIWNRSCLGKVFNQYPTRRV